MSVTPNVTAVQASTYLQGATDVTLRHRPLLGWMDRNGRISRNATGRDWNWKLKYKLPVAEPYQAYDSLSFTNDNYWLPASVQPVFFNRTSGMDVTEIITNTGPSQIIDAYGTRVQLLSQAMEVYLAKSLFMDGNGSGAGRPNGLATLTVASGTCTNGDRICAPGGTYAGLTMGLGTHGGSWSSNITGANGSEFPMNVALGTDWPDGQGDPTQMYDGTSPRLYNECSNRWNDPAAASGANSSWRTNCISMLSRANEDLRMNSVESMMPTLHLSGSQRNQDVKDKLRESMRDIGQDQAFQNLGYHDVYHLEGSAFTTEFECPGDRTYSLCAESMELMMYSGAEGAKIVAEQGWDMSRLVTGGIYMLIGPTQLPGSLVTAWILFAGGQTRFSPKWVVCHKNWITA